MSEAIEREIREQLAGGNALSANDLAAALLGQGSPAIRYLYLQSLAAAGATQRALNRYEELAPPPGERSEDWLALPARLHKDLAFAGIEPEFHLARAAALYDEARDRTGGTFSGINAATLHYLAGNLPVARKLAAQVLADLAREAPSDERSRYYWHATRAEALLLLERTEEARVALVQADPLIREDLTARSRTRAQLARILDRQHPRAKIELQIALPAIYLFDPAQLRGPIVLLDAALSARIEGSPVFMPAPLTPEGLAAARALLQAGARIHLTLPVAAAQLCARVEAVHGAGAALAALVGEVERSSTLTGFLDHEGDWREVQSRRLAHGLARAAASSLGSDVRVIRIGEHGWQVDAEPAPPEAMAEGRRQMVGLVFADAAGFSTYSDADIERYWNVAVPRFAAVFARAGAEVLLQQTWGDALHVVTANPQAAARIALELLAAVRQIRAEERGRLATLDMRIGAHFAPAFRGRDAIQTATTYYGTQLSFTARVEPVTPPGTVYVTEPFQAELELQAPGQFRSEYAGELPLAKRYGTFRLASLKPGPKFGSDGARRALCVGVTGHLGLDAAARARVEAAVAPFLKQLLPPGGPVRLLTGLAPGGDLVLSGVVRDAVTAAGGSLSVHALLVSTPQDLIAHWLRRAGELGDSPSDATRLQVEHTLGEWLEHSDRREPLFERASSAAAFQQLAARLARLPDLLIAVLRPGHAGQAGGTAEVVAWRRDPRQIPAEFAGTLPANPRRELLIVDPDSGAVEFDGGSARST